MATHSYRHRIDPKVEELTSFESISNKVFVAIFLLEFILKIIALGFVMKMNSYLRDGWNILDFMVLVNAVLEETAYNRDGFLFLRAFRVLKPLR